MNDTRNKELAELSLLCDAVLRLTSCVKMLQQSVEWIDDKTAAMMKMVSVESEFAEITIRAVKESLSKRVSETGEDSYLPPNHVSKAEREAI